MIKFQPHPEIAKPGEFNPAVHRAEYKYDYERIFADIASGKLDQRRTFRTLILNDLFFVVYFVMQIPPANHPFVVGRCREVENGPVTDTLDVWARYHFKSVIITQAETLQYHLKHPDHCTGIMAYARPLAKKFLDTIKQTCETSDLLKGCFPDVLYGKPESESPAWSLDGGITFKGANPSRKESTVEAWGLIEGMPQGRHFERVIFDDIETDDIRDSPDMLDKVFSKFQMAGNLGTGKDSDITRIIGTYYSHFGPIVRIRDLKYEDGRPMYHLRLVPGSDDGTRDGKPVLMEPITWEKAKRSEHFNSQQLCDPTPQSDIRLDASFLKPIEPVFIPRKIFKFMVLDQAGGDETDKQSKDLWSFGVFGVEPVRDEIGQSNVYILDLEADKMSHAEGINGVVNMYLRNGIIQQMGVEKVGLSTTEIHISNALKTRGRRLSIDGGNLVLLKPAGRSKVFRVESALQWPLNNGKVHYSTVIPEKYIDAIREEMRKFPFFHVDILDMIAYLYDIIKEYRFPDLRQQEEQKMALAGAGNRTYSPLTFGLGG